MVEVYWPFGSRAKACNAHVDLRDSGQYSKTHRKGQRPDVSKMTQGVVALRPYLFGGKVVRAAGLGRCLDWGTSILEVGS